MDDWRGFSAPFLIFARLEQVGELLDGENAFLFILPHGSCCHAMEQTEVILLLGLGLTHALKGAKRTVLIQDERRWCRRVSRDPFMEGFKKPYKVFGMMVQFDGVRCPVHPNDSSRSRRRVLESL